jgi:hypothetical protein
VLIHHEDGISAAHGRVLAAHLLGLDEVPCIVLAHLTPAQRRAYVLADNKLALNAGWDLEMLSLEIGELGEAGFDLSLTGFDEFELGELYRLPVIPRCGRVIRQWHHVWGIDDAGILLSQRAGGGGAAARGTARERACLPAGSDDREYARGDGA